MLLGLLATFGGGAGAGAFSATTGFAATVAASTSAGAGVALIGPTVYSVDPSSGGLYRTIAGTTTLLVQLGGRPTGLAAYNGLLYATEAASRQVVRIDPSTAAVTPVATLAGDPPAGIAADPSNGDLYVAAGSFLWRITGAASTTPAAGLYPAGTQLPGPPTTLYGVAVSNDGWVYVVNTADGHIWRLEAPARAGSSAPTPLTMTTLVGARGIGIIPAYALVSSGDGTITKVPIPDQTSASAVVALTGGSGGDLGTIGTDGCFYVSQGPQVVRLANADGTCDLARAGPPPPAPALTLANTSSVPPLVGYTQTFSVTLSGAPTIGGVAVTLTATRGTTTIYSHTERTGPNGVAGFAYAASSIGTDTLVASATIGSTTLTSNPVSVTWPRPIDTSPPRITYTVSAASTGANFHCPDPSRGTPGVFEYCGWYTAPPTVHWTVVPTGPTPVVSLVTCQDFTLNVSSPYTGTPVTCQARNADGYGSQFTVVLNSLIVPPTITTDTGSYVPGTWTSHDVTVRFACASDPALGSAGGQFVSFCSGPTTVSAEGTTTVNGYVLDVAGTRRDAAPVVVRIDKTPPVVSVAGYTTADGRPYLPGTPTTQDVTVRFACVDTYDPAPVCPAPALVTATGQSVTVGASDRAGNSASYTFTFDRSLVNIDRTGPIVAATVTPPLSGGAGGVGTVVTLTATDPSGIGAITYVTAGAQAAGPVTVAAPGSPATFATSLTLSTLGTTTVTYAATDALGNPGASGTLSLTIVSTLPSTLAFTSPPVQSTGGTAVSLLLRGADGTPIPGRTLTISGAGPVQTVTTGADGTARLPDPLPAGVYTLSASFAGDSQWYPSSASQSLTVAGATTFVIWGGNGVQVGQRAVFWGEHWWDGVRIPEKARVKEFKGWAATVTGTTWSTKPGDSKPPRTVPTYISVLITTSVQRASGGERKGDDDRISGNIVGHAILRVDSPYRDEPGRPASGVVVAVLP
jgi:hypothetical protein